MYLKRKTLLLTVKISIILLASFDLLMAFYHFLLISLLRRCGQYSKCAKLIHNDGDIVSPLIHH